jgi:hypothetical protein
MSGNCVAEAERDRAATDLDPIRRIGSTGLSSRAVGGRGIEARVRTAC